MGWHPGVLVGVLLANAMVGSIGVDPEAARPGSPGVAVAPPDVNSTERGNESSLTVPRANGSLPTEPADHGGVTGFRLHCNGETRSDVALLPALVGSCVFAGALHEDGEGTQLELLIIPTENFNGLIGAELAGMQFGARVLAGRGVPFRVTADFEYEERGVILGLPGCANPGHAVPGSVWSCGRMNVVDLVIHVADPGTLTETSAPFAPGKRIQQVVWSRGPDMFKATNADYVDLDLLPHSERVEMRIELEYARIDGQDISGIAMDLPTNRWSAEGRIFGSPFEFQGMPSSLSIMIAHDLFVLDHDGDHVSGTIDAAALGLLSFDRLPQHISVGWEKFHVLECGGQADKFKLDIEASGAPWGAGVFFKRVDDDMSVTASLMAVTRLDVHLDTYDDTTEAAAEFVGQVGSVRVDVSGAFRSEEDCDLKNRSFSLKGSGLGSASVTFDKGEDLAELAASIAPGQRIDVLYDKLFGPLTYTFDLGLLRPPSECRETIILAGQPTSNSGDYQAILPAAANHCIDAGECSSAAAASYAPERRVCAATSL